VRPGAVRTALRLVRMPAVVLVPYFGLRAVLERLTERGGLLSPSGSVDPAVALAGVLVLLLRLTVLFVLPAVATYRGVALLLDRGWPERTGPGNDDRGRPERAGPGNDDRGRPEGAGPASDGK
jgi:hypothetical protein